MYAVVSDGASIVDFSGNPASNFTAGTSLFTGSGTALQVDPGFAIKFYPDTDISIFNLLGNAVSGYSISQESASFISSDQLGQAMLEKINKAFEDTAEIYKTNNPISKSIATLKAFSWIRKGYLEMAGGDLNDFGMGVSYSAGFVPDGTAFAMNVDDNGTAIGVTNGTVLVFSLSASTLKYVILQAGQQIFIPNNQTMADQQDLNASIQPFQPIPTTTIPATIPPNLPNSGSGTAVIIVIVMLIALVLLVRSRSKQQKVEGGHKSLSNEDLNRLEKLNGLLKSRAISRQEFNEQKEEIVGKKGKASIWNTIAIIVCYLIFMIAILYLIA